MSTRVLLIDAEAGGSSALHELTAHSAGSQVVGSLSAAVRTVAQQKFDVAVCVVANDATADEAVSALKKVDAGLPVVLAANAPRAADVVSALKRGATDFIDVAADAEEVQRAIAEAAEGAPRRVRSGVRPIATRSALIGDSPAMRELRSRIELVAGSSAPVVIYGESGTGKELVARAIHDAGPRASRPFVGINTAAIPEQLLESAVFGHVRGAFSGAVQSHRGHLLEADGGTLLLDEIGDMPIGLQAKLLRVLQLGEVRPVGSETSHHVDVRIVAATHRDLASLIREGRFREDLYFRLNVLPISVPPLRDRRADIPLLAEHFLEEARKRSPLSPVRSFGSDAIAALEHAPWPGNVRELESAIERIVVLGRDEVVRAEHLVDVLGKPMSEMPWPTPQEGLWTLRQLSESYVDWVLGQVGGNKVRAARILGIDLSTLYRWARRRREPPVARLVANGDVSGE